MAEGPKSRRFQFETDNEEQEHDAELGEMQKFLAIGNQAGHWTNRDACGKIAEDRAKP